MALSLFLILAFGIANVRTETICNVFPTISNGIRNELCNTPTTYAVNNTYPASANSTGPTWNITYVTEWHQTVNTSVGSICSISCDVGYVPSSSGMMFECQEDLGWVNTETQDGLFDDSIVCVDYNACEMEPCDSQVSECIDDMAPSMGYSCACLDTYSGEPGVDGSGCGRASLETMDGNFMMMTGEGNDVMFHLGKSRHSSIGQMLEDFSALRDADEKLSEDIAGVAQDLVDAKKEASDALTEAVNELNEARNDVEDRLDKKVDDEITRAKKMEDLISDDVTAVEGRVGVLEGDVDNLEIKSGLLSNEIKGVDGDLTSEVMRAKQKENSLQSSLNSVTSKANTLRNDVDDLVDELQDTNDAIDALSGDLGQEVSRAKAKENSLQTQVNKAQSDATSALGKFSSYYTKTQTYTQTQVNNKVNAVANARYTKAQVDSLLTTVRGEFYPKATVDSKITSSANSVKSWVTNQLKNYAKKSDLNNYYTKNDLNSRMTFPINAGAIRKLPIVKTNFMQDDDHSYYNVAVNDGYRWSIRITTSSLEAFYSFWVPSGWYFYSYDVRSRYTRNTRIRTTYPTSSSTYAYCSSYSNRKVGCNLSGRNGWDHMLDFSASSTGDYIYGGWYEIRKY